LLLPAVRAIPWRTAQPKVPAPCSSVKLESKRDVSDIVLLVSSRRARHSMADSTARSSCTELLGNFESKRDASGIVLLVSSSKATVATYCGGGAAGI
jgi:hypothetical protein